jgi:hypothetical protein
VCSRSKRKARAVGAASRRSSQGVISTQVLQEHASFALSKLAQPEAVVLRQLTLLEAIELAGSSDITLALVGRRSANAYYPKDSWYFVKERPSADDTVTVDASSFLGLFRRR